MIAPRSALLSALLVTPILFLTGCSSSSDAPAEDSTAEDLSQCHPLVEGNAAKLMAAGSSERDDAGSFVVQTSTRDFSDVTGAGPWTAWSDYTSGTIDLYAMNDAELGPIVQMQLLGPAPQEYGQSQEVTAWDIDTGDGIVADGNVSYRTTEVVMNLKGIGDYGTLATFQTTSFRSSTCSFAATSDVIRQGATELRVRVQGRFKKPK